MEWTDRGVVLAVRRHGESGAIVSALTEMHGRHSGLVRGGSGRASRGVLQVANEVSIVWRGRLPEHLGSFRCELSRARAAEVMDDSMRLAGVTSTCAVLERALPERHTETEIFLASLDVLDAIERHLDWPTDYVRWEMALLAQLGFGLDLTHSALSGKSDDLAYVSPRSGRAVTRAEAEPYRDRLLRLPTFLTPQGERDQILPSAADISAGLALTGYFLTHAVLAPHGYDLPDARSRLLAYFEREATRYGAIVES